MIISPILPPCIIFLIQTVRLPSVGSTPLDNFMSVRRQKCSLSGEDVAPHQIRRYEMPPMPNVPIEMWPPEAQGLVSQRQKATMKKNKGPTKMGPSFSDTYAPNPGFEPYWVGGNWVLDNIKANEEKQSDPNIKDSYCGYECNESMRNFGVVCGAMPIKGGLQFKYQTFDNLCMMKKEECKFDKGWTMVHRGPCTITLQTYNWQNARKEGEFHKKAVDLFYKKYNRPVGSAYNVTRKWTYGLTFLDAGVA